MLLDVSTVVVVRDRKGLLHTANLTWRFRVDLLHTLGVALLSIYELGLFVLSHLLFKDLFLHPIRVVRCLVGLSINDFNGTVGDPAALRLLYCRLNRVERTGKAKH